MPNASKILINDAFNERYETIYRRGHHDELEPLRFVGELEFLKKLYELIEDSICEAPSFTPSIWQLTYFKKNGLKTAIEKLENFI